MRKKKILRITALRPPYQRGLGGCTFHEELYEKKQPKPV